MAKIKLECPVDVTSPPMKKCWTDQKNLQKTLTAAIIKKFECKDDCDLYVIVNLKELGPCPTNPRQKEFEVIVEIGCIRVVTQQEFYCSNGQVEKLFSSIFAEIQEEPEEQHKC
jgi:hypothetical protein